MIQVTDTSRCCGCTACKSICPHAAITMVADRLGFLYPQVDMEKCVECGACEKVCAFVSDVDSRVVLPDDAQLEVNAVRHVDTDVLEASQSGGAFTAISDMILDLGGVVYGAAYTDRFSVAHMRTSTKKERDLLRGSKYVQSELQETFRNVRNDLRNGIPVLFTGTPCQVSGLKEYIPDTLRNNLFLVDFICHGVPSPAVWEDYLKYMGRHGKIINAKFRDKSVHGWKVHQETFTYQDGVQRRPDTFRVLFYKNIMLRHSCAVCPYNASNHYSDITIADFWGVGELVPSMDGDSGTSMVFCNTEKGNQLFDKAKSLLDVEKVTLNRDFMLRKNPNLVSSSKIYKDRLRFEEEYAEKGFLHVARKWGDLGWRYRWWKLKVRIRKMIGIK